MQDLDFKHTQACQLHQPCQALPPGVLTSGALHIFKAQRPASLDHVRWLIVSLSVQRDYLLSTKFTYYLLLAGCPVSAFAHCQTLKLLRRVQGLILDAV